MENIPGMISLLAGKPNASTFPFESFSISLKDGNRLTIDKQDLEEALQYGPTAGHPRLNKWIQDFQCRVHGKKSEQGWRVSIVSVIFLLQR